MFVFFRTVLFIKAVGKIKNKKYKPPTHPNFSQNLDRNLKINLVWPYHVEGKTECRSRSADLGLH